MYNSARHTRDFQINLFLKSMEMYSSYMSMMFMNKETKTNKYIVFTFNCFASLLYRVQQLNPSLNTQLTKVRKVTNKVLISALYTIVEFKKKFRIYKLSLLFQMVNKFCINGTLCVKSLYIYIYISILM